MTARSVTASAPGKVIVSGEHFVVHGSYAVAAAVNKRVRVTVQRHNGFSIISSGNKNSRLDSNGSHFSACRSVASEILNRYDIGRDQIKISVESEIPSGSGLGSSAAVSVATAAAMLKYFNVRADNKALFDIAVVGERRVHGNPSGIDVQASLLGGMILFNKKTGARAVPLPHAIQLLVVYSGITRSTSSLIAKVAERKDKFPSTFEHLANSASFLSLEVVEAVTTGDLPYLGALMNLAQTSLAWIGVSNQNTDKIIDTLLSKDVFGAKITGAGGGGSVISLPKPGRSNAILKRISKSYSQSFLFSIPEAGVRLEN